MNRQWLQTSALLGLLLAAPASAITINYGDCDDLAGGGSVTYEQVTESNAGTGALYRAPSCTGNLIDFNPLGFEAKDDSDGNVTPVQTSGMLEFAIQAVANHALTSISLSEAGDEQVFGFGPAAYAMATMTTDLSIFVSDGGGGQVAVAYHDVRSVLYELPGDHSSSVGPWSIDADYIVGDILTDACLGQGQYAGNAISEACGASTDRVLVQIDNLLEAFSEDGALAYINKKDTDNVALTTVTTFVPEPNAGVLLGLGLLGLAIAGRRRTAVPRGSSKS